MQESEYQEGKEIEISRRYLFNLLNQDFLMLKKALLIHNEFTEQSFGIKFKNEKQIKKINLRIKQNRIAHKELKNRFK